MCRSGRCQQRAACVQPWTSVRFWPAGARAALIQERLRLDTNGTSARRAAAQSSTREVGEKALWKCPIRG